MGTNPPADTASTSDSPVRSDATVFPTADAKFDPSPELARPILRPRLNSIDLLRGLIMVVMVLDHTRGFLAGNLGDVRDVTYPALFLTRWITHFCAPIFIFLAGLSAFLYGERGRTKPELSRYLLTRGAWLVLLELTVVRFGWSFDYRFSVIFLQVIWVIGWSMIALGGLVFLPHKLIAAIALAVIAGHNLLDSIQAAQFGTWNWVWHLIHQPGFLSASPETRFLILYPLAPWFAVMAAGYALGPVFKWPAPRRRRALMALGVMTVVVFIAGRALNLYGNPRPWVSQPTWSATVLSFIDCEKYPPSLLFLTMTLGPALVALAVFERARGRLAEWLITFGRVPFLFYVAHLYLLHVIAVAVALLTGFEIGWLFRELPAMNMPRGYGVTLPVAYVIWVGVLMALYPICAGFARLKQKRKDWWLSYL